MVDLGKFFVRNYQPLNRIEINKKSLLANYRILGGFGLKIAPVLKSNAYGHGILEIARLLDNKKAPFFCVDSLFEAYALSNDKIQTPILVMGYVAPQSLRTKMLPFSFAVSTKSQLEALARFQPHAPVHIFVDTGMHREGFMTDELPKLIAYLKKTKVNVEGLMSHYAESENPGLLQTKLQLQLFSLACMMFEQNGFSIKYRHVQNSSGILNGNALKGVSNVGRAGIALYGIDPLGRKTMLKPVASLHTQIAQVKTIKRNEGVGYGFSYHTKKTTKIAVLPIGYHDGVDRRLSNRGFVQVNGLKCPILGLVSMNIATVDVSRVKEALVGSDVVVYSSNKIDTNTIEKSARLIGTIPYELLVHLHPSTKRVVV